MVDIRSLKGADVDDVPDGAGRSREALVELAEVAESQTGYRSLSVAAR
jgi:hypothetical protein